MVLTVSKRPDFRRISRDRASENHRNYLVSFSNVDLSSADIQSGKVDLTKMNCEKQSWVVYQYHMSPGLKHSSSPLKLLNSFGEIMDSEYIRTIPIVSPSGIESFFNWASESL